MHFNKWTNKESLACQITSLLNKKPGFFENKIKKISSQKQPIFLLNGEAIWQARDSPLSKELHGLK